MQKLLLRLSCSTEYVSSNIDPPHAYDVDLTQLRKYCIHTYICIYSCWFP